MTGRRGLAVNKIALVGLVVLALLGLFAVGMVRSTLEADEQSRLAVVQSYETIDRLNETFGLVQDVEIGSRGYMITGDAAFLDPYYPAMAIIKARLTELDASADPERRLLGEFIRAKVNRAAATVSLRQHDGLEAAVRAVSTKRGKQMMDAVRSQLATIIRSERELLTERSALHSQAETRASRVIFLALAAAQLLAIGIGILLIRYSTHRRAAEVEARRRAARLRATLENIGSGIALLDADGQIVDRNDRLAALLNPGRRPTDPVWLGGAELAAVRAREPLRLERVVGDDVAVEVNGQPANDGLYVLTYTDVSSRHQSDRLKNDFVSTVSHELRTPLTAIRGALGLVVGPLAGSIPDNVQQLLEVADRNALRLTGLVNDLLDIDKLESGRMTLDLRPVDLNLIALEAAESNRGLAVRRGIRLTVGSTVEPVMVMADAGRLLQVVTNLISNSVKFSPDEQIVTITVERRGALAWLSVHDRGAGIPADFHARIFGRFAQAASGDAKRIGGSGLGLHISKAIVEQHGGDISFESRPGDTKFVFSLSVIPIRQGLSPSR